LNRLAMIEALKLSEERIRGVRQELERLEGVDIAAAWAEEARKRVLEVKGIDQELKALDARKVGVSV
jgi:hypothetical protein